MKTSGLEKWQCTVTFFNAGFCLRRKNRNIDQWALHRALHKSVYCMFILPRSVGRPGSYMSPQAILTETLVFRNPRDMGCDRYGKRNFFGETADLTTINGRGMGSATDPPPVQHGATQRQTTMLAMILPLLLKNKTKSDLFFSLRLARLEVETPLRCVCVSSFQQSSCGSEILQKHSFLQHKWISIFEPVGGGAQRKWCFWDEGDRNRDWVKDHL